MSDAHSTGQEVAVVEPITIKASNPKKIVSGESIALDKKICPSKHSFSCWALLCALKLILFVFIDASNEQKRQRENSCGKLLAARSVHVPDNKLPEKYSLLIIHHQVDLR